MLSALEGTNYERERERRVGRVAREGVDGDTVVFVSPSIPIVKDSDVRMAKTYIEITL